MTLQLYAHPFSSYCQKVLIALYENDTPFVYRHLGSDATAFLELATRWPLKRCPILVDDAKIVVESSIIIEHLHVHHPGPVKLLPDSVNAALEVRMMDRFFDNYIATPMQRIVADFARAPDIRDPTGVLEARAVLDSAYAWLDGVVANRTWACGEGFTLADCAARPNLFYADWVHEIHASHQNVKSYRARLLARPAFARVIDEADVGR